MWLVLRPVTAERPFVIGLINANWGFQLPRHGRQLYLTEEIHQPAKNNSRSPSRVSSQSAS